jgi:hypothetical protein
MTDTQETAVPAGEEPIVEAQEVEAVETTEDSNAGQVEIQPDAAEPEGKAEKETAEAKSKSQIRREARKAKMEELEAAKADTEARLERITKAGEGDKEPTEDEYPDYAEYAAAKAVWRAEQKRLEREASNLKSDSEDISAKKAAEIDAEFFDQVGDARTRYQDYDAVAFANFPVSDAMVGIIKESDRGADVLYHLGSNPELSRELAHLPPLAAARRIGQIEAALTTQPAPIRQTKAPEPITPVTPKATAQKDPSKMTIAEYRKWRSAGG